MATFHMTKPLQLACNVLLCISFHARFTVATPLFVKATSCHTGENILFIIEETFNEFSKTAERRSIFEGAHYYLLHSNSIRKYTNFPKQMVSE